MKYLAEWARQQRAGEWPAWCRRRGGGGRSCAELERLLPDDASALHGSCSGKRLLIVRLCIFETSFELYVSADDAAVLVSAASVPTSSASDWLQWTERWTAASYGRYVCLCSKSDSFYCDFRMKNILLPYWKNQICTTICWYPSINITKRRDYNKKENITWTLFVVVQPQHYCSCNCLEEGLTRDNYVRIQNQDGLKIYSRTIGFRKQSRLVGSSSASARWHLGFARCCSFADAAVREHYWVGRSICSCERLFCFRNVQTTGGPPAPSANTSDTSNQNDSETENSDGFIVQNDRPSTSQSPTSSTNPSEEEVRRRRLERLEGR